MEGMCGWRGTTIQPRQRSDKRGGLFSPPRRGGPMSLGFIARGERIPRWGKRRSIWFFFFKKSFNIVWRIFIISSNFHSHLSSRSRYQKFSLSVNRPVNVRFPYLFFFRVKRRRKWEEEIGWEMKRSVSWPEPLLFDGDIGQEQYGYTFRVTLPRTSKFSISINAEILGELTSFGRSWRD